MKRLYVIILTAFLALPSMAQTARIKIDTDRKIGEIDRNLYSNFTEHLGRCIYGGIYDPESSQADEAGLRKDVLQAIRDLNVSITR